MGAHVAETPPDNAIVTAPGLLPREVDAAYPPCRYTTLSKTAVQVLAASEDAHDELWSENVRVAEDGDSPVGDCGSQPGLTEHSVEVQTLHGPRRTSPQNPPSRVVVLRSRYARARKHEGRASDPPAH